MKNFLEKSKLPKLTKEKIENLKKTIPLDNLIWQSKISVFHMDMCTYAHTHKYTKQKGPQVFYREVLPTLKGQVILILNYSIVKEKKERLPTDFYDATLVPKLDEDTGRKNIYKSISGT